MYYTSVDTILIVETEESVQLTMDLNIDNHGARVLTILEVKAEDVCIVRVPCLKMGNNQVAYLVIHLFECKTSICMLCLGQVDCRTDKLSEQKNVEKHGLACSGELQP